MRTAPPVAALSLLSLSFLAVGTHAGGQTGGGAGGGGTQPTEFPWETTVNVPNTVTEMDTIVRMRAGDIDLDLRPDVFVRGAPAASGARGSHEIVFLYAPWAGSAPVKLAQSANDFDVQPGAAPGLATNLVTVDADGLKLVRWNAAFTPPFEATLETAATGWPGATIVRHAELDGAAGADYVGVASDRRTVLLRSNGGATNVSFLAPADVVAVEPLSWIVGGAQEIAVLTANGLCVHNADGTVADNFVFGAPKESTIAVLRYVNGLDRIAWASSGSPGQPWSLDVVRRNTPQFDVTFALPWSGVVGISANDMDLDGDFDLAVATTETRALRVYSNGSADGLLRVFAPARSQSVSNAYMTPVGALPYAGAPLFAELSNYGRADLLVPVEQELELDGEVIRITRFEVMRSKRVGLLTSEEAFEPNTDFGFVPTATEANVTFVIDTSDFNGQATHLQVTAWTQANAQSALNPVSDGPIRRYPINLSQYDGTPELTWEVNLTVPLANGTVCGMPIRWFEIRLVKYDANDVLVQAWPTYVCAVLTQHSDYCVIDNNNVNNVELPLVGTGSAPITCGGWSTACEPQPPEGNWPAAAITRRRKADPPPGVVPIVPAFPYDMTVIPLF